MAQPTQRERIEILEANVQDVNQRLDKLDNAIRELTASLNAFRNTNKSIRNHSTSSKNLKVKTLNFNLSIMLV